MKFKKNTIFTICSIFFILAMTSFVKAETETFTITDYSTANTVKMYQEIKTN